ncbi:MAG TPA: TetR/AcrR family transcriptional regulator [Solirubrobacteraceae bacterium]|nr:TetR/AcrR family transcriptional regulator [Solirubrobacteraceae bacterium]
MPRPPVPATPEVPATPKGRRGRQRLLDAATEVLAREGFGGASIARITEQAGVPKRMVVYYFGTREALLATVLEGIADRIAATAAANAPEAAEPPQAVAAWFDALWTGATGNPEIPRAYFALIGGNWTDVTRDALDQTRRSFTAVLDSLIQTCLRAGFALEGDRDGFELFALSLTRGLLLEWIEAGDTPALRHARTYVEQTLAAAFVPAPG